MRVLTSRCLEYYCKSKTGPWQKRSTIAAIIQMLYLHYGVYSAKLKYCVCKYIVDVDLEEYVRVGVRDSILKSSFLDTIVISCENYPSAEDSAFY